jgi:hypothetical protein
LRRLRNYSEPIALFVVAGALAVTSVFALRCRIEQDRMMKTIHLVEHRQRACLQLRWRWEAEDQDHQYIESSAGSTITVGPIAGYVMDVTENEYGHAVGQCHLENEPYIDLVSRY